MVAWHRAGVSGAVSDMAISVFNVALAVLREPASSSAIDETNVHPVASPWSVATLIDAPRGRIGPKR
jgi:hypothetical protein